ncbi:hypothetical protein [Euzebya sp.]|uniref:hypothetical protein n=1 Tax=Euzebya sp. TaxID=1971409 RepID=UPI0035114714
MTTDTTRSTEPAKSINTVWRFPLIVGLSVVLGAPVLSDMALMNASDLANAGVRYLAALALAWFGVSTVFRVIDRYQHENAMAIRLAELEVARAEAERLAALRAEAAAAEAAAAEDDAREMESV